MDNEIFQKIKEVAEREMADFPDAAHDMSHVMRVHRLALRMAERETGVDLDVLSSAVLLHDIGSYRELNDPSGNTDHAVESAKMAEPILKDLGFTDERIRHIQDCIISHRYKTDNEPKTIEAKILFDADKLDAVGAIGVARSFCWTGKNNANIYKKVDIDEYVRENMGGKINGKIHDKTKHSPQIEFAVKYRFLADKLFTRTAREICGERVKFFEDFLNRLEREVNGEI